MRTLIVTMLFAALLVAPATAQVYPSQSETPVTDDAELLNPVQEAELAARITALEQETGSDVAVVTLPGTQFYTMGEDLDVYAAGLVADWGLGATTGDRAVLMLVFRDDRELYLSAGTGFSDDEVAQTDGIVNDVILPQFRADDYPAGISAGVEAIAARILTAAETAPAAEGTGATPAADGGGGGNLLLWAAGGVAALIALVVGANRRAKAKLAATPCPSCGKTGLTRERVTLRAATETEEGRGEVRTTCPSCGHTDAEPFSVPRRKPEVAAKKSDGGGTKGEW